MQPRSIREHSDGSYMRNSYAKEFSKKLNGKSSPDSAGSHSSSLKAASFTTKSPVEVVKRELEKGGFTKGSDNSYYSLDKVTRRGTKADLSTVHHKPSFYAEPEPWTQVEFTSVIEKQ